MILSLVNAFGSLSSLAPDNQSFFFDLIFRHVESKSPEISPCH